MCITLQKLSEKGLKWDIYGKIWAELAKKLILGQIKLSQKFKGQIKPYSKKNYLGIVVSPS